jgi:hypothetical protein
MLPPKPSRAFAALGAFLDWVQWSYEKTLGGSCPGVTATEYTRCMSEVNRNIFSKDSRKNVYTGFFSGKQDIEPPQN